MIAGGGTGGHIVPSLQIARALVERGHAADTIELYGSRRGQEATHLADARVPLHAAARDGGCAGACGPSAWWANVGGAAGTGVGLRPRPGLVPRPAPSGGGHRRRLCQLPGRGGGGADEGAAGVGEHRRRAGRRQRSARPFRRGQRGGLRRDGPAPGARHRHAGAARARIAGPDTRRPAAPAGPRSACPADRQTVACVGGSLGARRVNRAVAELAGIWARCEGRSAVPRHRTTGLRGVRAGRGGPGRRGARRAVPPRGAVRGPHAAPLRRRPTSA